jgi:hypothetical protein
MMVGVFGPSVENILSKVNQVLLLMASHLAKMQVLSRLSKV